MTPVFIFLRIYLFKTVDYIIKYLETSFSAHNINKQIKFSCQTIGHYLIEEIQWPELFVFDLDPD